MKKSFYISVLMVALLITALIGLPDQASAGAALVALSGLGMIFSAQQLFSEDQDLAQVAGTYASTNIINTGTPGTVYGAAAALGRDVGKGVPVPILVQITEDFTSAGASTLQVQIEVADNAAFSTNNEVIAESRAYPKAECVAGKQFEVAYLPNDCRQYLRVNYVIGTATTTAGKCTAGITMGNQTNA